MISKIELISNENSVPFSTATVVCDLERRGYEENEYYMYGTGNLYSRNKQTNKAEQIYSGAPYVNRFIVRAPKDLSRASGNIVLELINPSSGMEIERMWIETWEKFTRDGDIYVGLTIKPNTLESLKAYSEERYGRLDWSNPRKEMPFPFTDEERLQIPFLGNHISHDFETGLCWDMITDMAALLRSENAPNPLAAAADKKLLLTGWSQDCSYIRTYVNYFANEMDTDPFDGYLLGGGVAASFTPINQYEALEPVDSNCKRVHACRVPFMVVQTESDASARASYYGKKPNSDHPGFPYRLYEIAGGSHDTEYNLLNYYAAEPNLQKAAATLGGALNYSGQHEFPNDYPYEFIWNAMYRNMFYWIREGVAPAAEELIWIDEKGMALRDGFGNSIGGVRTCLLDYPIAHYSSADEIGVDGASFTRNSSEEFSAFGYRKPFSAAMLKELYGTLENYRVLCTEHTLTQVNKGFICRCDAKKLIDLAVERAAKAGLE